LDINGLNHVFHLFDLLLNIISRDQVIVDGGSDDKLEDTEGNRGLLVFGLPVESSLLVFDSEDSLGEGVEVGLVINGLNLSMRFPKG